MRAAIVDISTWIVVNIIVADASTDVAPEGFVLIDASNVDCFIGWSYDPQSGTFVNTDPVVI